MEQYHESSSDIQSEGVGVQAIQLMQDFESLTALVELIGQIPSLFSPNPT